jgi:putative acetyltransferase
MLIRKIANKDNPIMSNIIRNSLLEFNAAKPGTVFFDESTDHISNLFETKKSAYFIIEIDNEIAGGGGYFPTKGLDENTCELVKLYVSKNFRNRGLGKILLEKCIKEAKEDGFKKMYLESMPELVDAIALYAKNGFYKIRKPMGNSGHTGCDIWMMKDL